MLVTDSSCLTLAQRWIGIVRLDSLHIPAVQGLVLVALGGASLSLWGVGVASPLRQNALDFLLIKALGAPATLLLMVAQVLLLNPSLASLPSGRTPYRGNCLAAEA